MKTEREWRDDVLRRLERLADRKVNDAVKLAFLGVERMDEIDGMDLGGLTELKRHGNGAVEIKLVDKLEALEKLCEVAKSGGEGAEEFFRALERRSGDTAGRDGRAEKSGRARESDRAEKSGGAEEDSGVRKYDGAEEGGGE